MSDLTRRMVCLAVLFVMLVIAYAKSRQVVDRELSLIDTRVDDGNEGQFNFWTIVTLWLAVMVMDLI